MIIVYSKDSANISECKFLTSYPNACELQEADGYAYHPDRGTPCHNMAKAGWFAVPEQNIPVQEINDDNFPISRTIGELNLTLFTADTLPKSQHIAKLKAVNPAILKPATVTRRFLGELYDVDCFVTQGVKDEYVAGDINIGDFVIVSYTRTGDDGETLPIVTGKVFRSW